MIKETKSAADFSISIENLPTNMTQEVLQRCLDRYRDELKKNNY